MGNSEIGPGTDFESLLRRHLTGGTSLSGQSNETPEQGVINLFSALQGSPLLGVAAAAATHLLTDSDLNVRAGAVAAVQEFPRDFDPSVILKILEENARLYQGVGANHFGRKQPDLAWALLRGLAAIASTNADVRNRLRSAMQDRTNGTEVLAGVVANDKEWVICHPVETIQADPTRAWIALLNLGDATSRERFTRAVPQESPGACDALKAGIRRAIQNSVERDRLLSLTCG